MKHLIFIYIFFLWLTCFVFTGPPDNFVNGQFMNSFLLVRDATNNTFFRLSSYEINKHCRNVFNKYSWIFKRIKIRLKQHRISMTGNKSRWQRVFVIKEIISAIVILYRFQWNFKTCENASGREDTYRCLSLLFHENVTTCPAAKYLY